MRRHVSVRRSLHSGFLVNRSSLIKFDRDSAGTCRRFAAPAWWALYTWDCVPGCPMPSLRDSQDRPVSCDRARKLDRSRPRDYPKPGAMYTIPLRGVRLRVESPTHLFFGNLI